MGPPWIRYGGRIFYKASALATWEDEQQNLSPAEYKASRAAATPKSVKSTPQTVGAVMTKKIAADRAARPSTEVPAPPLEKVRRPNLSRRIASSLEAAVAKLQASLAGETDYQASVRLVESIGFLNQLLAHKRYADAQGAGE